MLKRITLAAFIAAAVTIPAIAPTPAAAEGKVTICHVPPGNPADAHEISVGISAVPAHLAHGDNVGGCERGPA